MEGNVIRRNGHKNNQQQKTNKQKIEKLWFRGVPHIETQEITGTWKNQFSSVQSLSHVQLFVTPWTAACQASLSFPVPEFAQIHVHWVGDAIQLSHPLLSPSPPALHFSQHQGPFPVSQFFTSGGQSIGASASAAVLLVNIQGWFPLELTDLISLQSRGLSRVFSSNTVQKHQLFSTQPFYGTVLTSVYDYWKIHSFSKVMSLLFNMLSMFVIAFLAVHGSQRVGHDWATELNWTDETKCHDLNFLIAEFCQLLNRYKYSI